MPELILQPPNSETCGHFCVAMAASRSVDEVVAVIGHSHATHTWEVRDALRHFGVACADRCKVMKRLVPTLPKRGLLVVRKEEKSYLPGKRLHHWMLAWDGTILDPGGKWPHYEGWRVTSYLEIYN